MKQLKILIAVGCGAIAVVLFWSNHQDEPAIPDTPDSETVWMCRDCLKPFPLTAAAVAKAEAKAGGAAPLVCQDCGKREVYRAAQCPRCGTYYFSKDVPGSLGRCPKCYPPETDNGAPAEEKREPPPPAA